MNGLMTLASAGLAAEGAGSAVTTIDFTDMLTSSLNGIVADFGKYAMVAGAVALTIWGAPKAIMLAKKFFTAVSR